MSHAQFQPIQPRLGAVDQTNAKEFVFGRSHLVDTLWRRLEAGSLRLVAERRMGKTWVLHLALANAPEWAVPVLFDAQKHRSDADLILEINRVLHEKGLLPDAWWQKVWDWSRRKLHDLRGKKLNQLEVPEIETSAAILEETCREFVKAQSGKRPVLIIDEFPFLLDKLVKEDSCEAAEQLLDSLRSLRHELPDLRMVFCGSLGLHIVLDRLAENRYTGRPVNDMPPFEVPPLDESDAVALAGGLLLGSSVPCSDLSKVAEEVARGGSCVPFYIQHLVMWMDTQSRKEWTPDDARQAPLRLFDAANDPGEFRYYDQRLDQYYPDDVVAKARAILFQLCHDAEGLEFNDLVNRLRHTQDCVETHDHEAQKVLETLRDDHYLVSDGNRWRFKVEIIRRWWQHTRGGRNR